MNIEAIPVSRTDEFGRELSSPIVRYRIRGEVTADNDVVRRARELLVRHGPPELVASFDRAISEQLMSRHD